MQININIPPNANKIIHTLQDHGHSAYIVGGCIRDSILGRIPNDWDICTSATPDEMFDIFKDNKIIKTGLQHGTITIIIDNEPYEVTTYRIDGIYSDSRRPDTVTFTDNIIEDLKRRDFTINAMAYNDIQGLIDPFNGIDDIENKKIRCVGLAKHRFDEDALRILRAIRFASQLDFEIEYNTNLAIKNQYTNLKNIAIERINNEFCKIISSDAFYDPLNNNTDVFTFFIPELNDIIGFPQYNPYHAFSVYGHTLSAMSHCESDDLIVKLATFFHDFGKPHCYQDGEDGIRHFKGHGRISADITDIIMQRLRFDNYTRNNVIELIYYHDATLEPTKKSIKRWLNKIGETQFRRLLELRKADIKGQRPDYEQSRIDKVNTIEQMLDDILQTNECFTLKDLEINGSDLINIGYKPDKELGNTLKQLLQLVINEECKNEKDILLEKANIILLERS